MMHSRLNQKVSELTAQIVAKERENEQGPALKQVVK